MFIFHLNYLAMHLNVMEIPPSGGYNIRPNPLLVLSMTASPHCWTIYENVVWIVPLKMVVSSEGLNSF